tara:strand:+ start:509 stop:748 length:240 start_codon:yes stop_codon:yes gene_type:complete
MDIRIGLELIGDINPSFEAYQKGKRWIKLGVITKVDSKNVWIEDVKTSKRILENNTDIRERKGKYIGIVYSVNIVKKFI